MRALIPRRTAAALAALLVAGLVITFVADSTVGDTIGFALFGLGAIGLVSLSFYVVGRSEDVERERSRP